MITVKGPDAGKLRDRARRAIGMFQQVMLLKLERDALKFVDIFQDGIRKNKFGLQPLNDAYVAYKRSLGLPKPAYPLYGVGDGSKRSYIKLFQVRRDGNAGFEATPRNVKHHEADLTLKQMFKVHEHGAVIGKGRIPARPAGKKAYRLARNTEKSINDSRDIRAGIERFVTTGDEGKIQKVVTRLRGEVANLRKKTA